MAEIGHINYGSSITFAPHHVPLIYTDDDCCYHASRTYYRVYSNRLEAVEGYQVNDTQRTEIVEMHDSEGFHGWTLWRDGQVFERREWNGHEFALKAP
jgi:hypothetical protein